MPPASPPLARLLGSTADVVQAVRSGRSLTELLARVDDDQRPAVQALAFHTLRRLGGALAACGVLASRTPPPPVQNLLVTAIALAWPDGRQPYADHTLVDQAVRAAQQRPGHAAGFVNAVLRRFLRERAETVALATRTPEGAHDHPAWWVQRLREDWPEAWPALLESARQAPPMTLRVNVRRCTGAAWLHRLREAGLDGALLDGAPWGGQAVVLDRAVPVARLPGFATGEVSVQDAAAQRAAPLLLGPDPKPGLRVLDACAAPGGKTGHLLELAEPDLLALDRDAARLERVRENLSRLGLNANLRAADAARPDSWWDGRPFDAILLDAPCTASGIVRRHPDVRWLRRPGDVQALAAEQARLLDALWPLLAPGGRLLYATCSVFRAEGSHQIDAFLQRLPAGTARRLPQAPGHLLPLADNPLQGAQPAAGPAHAAAAVHDGFFYALIEKP